MNENSMLDDPVERYIDFENEMQAHQAELLIEHGTNHPLVELGWTMIHILLVFYNDLQIGKIRL